MGRDGTVPGHGPGAALREPGRLGAGIGADGYHAVVRGVERLTGAEAAAGGVRAGAGLLPAGLVAEGETAVGEVHHTDRGCAGPLGSLRAPGRRSPGRHRNEAPRRARDVTLASSGDPVEPPGVNGR